MKKVIKEIIKKTGYKISKIEERKEKPIRNMTSREPLDANVIEPEYKQIIEELSSSGSYAADVPTYTMYKAMTYVVDQNIEGDIVECGVGDGNKIFIASKILKNRNIESRQFYLYDTYAGMTEPCEFDYKVSRERELGKIENVLKTFKEKEMSDGNNWCHSPLTEVKELISHSKYSPQKIHYVEGSVMDTIPNELHKKIAILRLDTDFYESSLHELRHLWDLVVDGGIIILDDYGGWDGQRRATDEFFKEKEISPLMIRTCWKERLILKPSRK